MPRPRALRVFIYALGVLAGVVALAIGCAYAISEWKIHRHYDAPLVALRAPLRMYHGLDVPAELAPSNP